MLSYIDKLRENRQAEEELNERIAAISASKDALMDSIASFKAQIQALRPS